MVLCSGQPPGMVMPWNLAVAVFLIPQPHKGHIRSSLFGFFLFYCVLLTLSGLGSAA